MNESNINWEQLNSNIKSCDLCNGLNSVELETLNSPGYGDINSKLVFIGQSLCGKLLTFDAYTETWRTLKLRKDPACPVCSQLITDN